MSEPKDEIKEYIRKKKEESKKIKEEIHKATVKEGSKIEKSDKEFDDFVNHIQLESNTTTSRKILSGIEDIKKILISGNKGNADKVVSSDKEAFIYINNSKFPFGDIMIGKGDVAEYLESCNEITIRNIYSMVDNLYNEDEDYEMSD